MPRPPKDRVKRLAASAREQLERLGYDPIEAMVRIAAKAERKGDLMLAGMMARELGQYVAPKLKAIEVSGQIDHGGGVLLIPSAPTNGDWEALAARVIDSTAQHIETASEPERALESTGDS